MDSIIKRKWSKFESWSLGIIFTGLIYIWICMGIAYLFGYSCGDVWLVGIFIIGGLGLLMFPKSDKRYTTGYKDNETPTVSITFFIFSLYLFLSGGVYSMLGWVDLSLDFSEKSETSVLVQKNISTQESVSKVEVKKKDGNGEENMVGVSDSTALRMRYRD